MPVYEFRCPRGTVSSELYLTHRGAPREVTCPCCEDVAERIPSAFVVDFYTSTHKALAAKGQIIDEPGLDRDIENNRIAQREKSAKAVEAAVDRVIDDAFSLEIS